MPIEKPLETKVGKSVEKPQWTIGYCFGCQEQRKFFYQQFKIDGGDYENYICEFCGLLEYQP